MKDIKKLFSAAVVVVGLLAGTVAAAPAAAANGAQEKKLGAVVRCYSDYDGVEVVKVGSLGTTLLRSLIRASVMDDIKDPDARAVLSLVRDVKGVTIMDYEDAPRSVRNAINSEIGAIYSRKDNLLMEVKDGDSDMYIFAGSDIDGSELKDLVLFTPSDGALIWIKGRISVDAIAAIAR